MPTTRDFERAGVRGVVAVAALAEYW